MDIKRIGTTKRWSDLTLHNNTLYLVEVPSKTLAGSFIEQTEEVLNSIEQILATNGSGKDSILMTTIYLSDITNIDLFNQVWDNWLPEGSEPVRACVEVKLAKSQYLVELQVVAALK